MEYWCEIIIICLNLLFCFSFFSFRHFQFRKKVLNLLSQWFCNSKILDLFTRIHVYVYICVCVCVYIYIYIYKCSLVYWVNIYEHLSGVASGKGTGHQFRRHKRCRFDPWIRKILWKRAWQSTLVFLPRKPHVWPHVWP